MTRSPLTLATALIVLTLHVPALAASALAPQLRDEEAYSETWTVVVDLPEDTYIQVQLAISNLGLGDENGACRILIVEGDAESNDTWTANQYRDRSDWGFRPPQHLAVGPCFIEADHEAGTAPRVHAEVGGGTVDMTLGAPIQVVAPPGHRIDTDDGFFEQKILIRHAPAAVYYRRPGAKQRRSNGFASIDHFRVTAVPSELARRWLRVYAFSAAGSLLMMAREPPAEDSNAVGWLWPLTSPRPMPLDSLTLRKIDDGWLMKAEAAGERWNAHLRRHLFRHAPLEQFGFVGWVAGGLLGNPVTHTWRAHLEGTAPGPTTAIIELTGNQ